MENYKNVEVVVFNDEMKPSRVYGIQEFMEECDSEHFHYLLRVGADYLPSPVGRHKLVRFNDMIFCFSGMESSFNFGAEHHIISDRFEGEDRRIFYTAADNEIHVKVLLHNMKVVNELVPIFCVFAKGDEILLWYYNVVQPKEREGTIYVLFRFDSTDFDGTYGVHFYIAGMKLFAEQLEYRRLFFKPRIGKV